MTVVDKTDTTQTDAITFEIDLHHPPEKVWRALTEPALLADWLLPAIGFKLEIGANFMFQTQPHPQWDGTVHCQFLNIEPPIKLSYAWVVGSALTTVVNFTLTPSPTGTKLRMVQSGFKADQKQNFGGARYGWRMMGVKLIDVLALIS